MPHKFLRELKVSPEEVIQSNIMDFLKLAPRKHRSKYGPRKAMTAEERRELSKERNRVHAKATRMRKRIFKKVLEVKPKTGAEAGKPKRGTDDQENGTSITINTL